MRSAVPGRSSKVLSKSALAMALCLGLLALTGGQSMADADVARGTKAFRVCAACHSLRPDLNMTGPSLAAVWGRKAGSLVSFGRYSDAVKASDITWDAKALDAWLKNPAQFIPGNWMTFAGIADAKTRADIIAFLKAVSQPGRGGPPVEVPAAYTETPMNLKQLPSNREVSAIRSCRDSYFVTTADGRTRPFWDESLRFETDASRFGPLSDRPVILPAGMFGDRATVIFASPKDISSFVKSQC